MLHVLQGAAGGATGTRVAGRTFTAGMRFVTRRETEL